LPNFILIVAHDLGPEELGSEGDRAIETPNLDRLAAQGLRFTEAYAGSPADAAARGSMLTGQDAGQARIRSEIQEPLALEDVTLAEVLRSVGYRSGFIGLWGLGWEGTTGHPNRQGFNEFLGALDLVHGAEEQTSFLWRNEVAFLLPKFPGSQKDDLAASWLVRGATNFIRINEDLPFFLLFSPNLPGSGLQRVWAGDSALNRYTNETWTALERARAVRITRLDAQVGTLLTELKRRNLEDDTVILFTSVPSQGASLSGSTNRFKTSSALRLEGGGLYEGNLRVPLIASWPGRIHPGTNAQPVAAWDILPTMADLAGAPIPPGLDGHSITNLLSGNESVTQRSAFYWESHGLSSRKAGRIGSWKGILQGSGPAWELYDLASDPRETINLARSRPEIIAQFETLFASQLRPWSAPGDGAVKAAGRPGIRVPTNSFKVPMRTNYISTGATIAK